MHLSLTGLYDKWDEQWSKVAYPQFYNKDSTFVDLAKQVTLEDSALLYKKCCLEAYSKTRTVTNADGSRAKGNPKRTIYLWAIIRDTIG